MGVPELAAEVIRAANARGVTVVTAESLTGGLIASALTGVPGASAVFLCGFVTYATHSKQTLLGVAERTLERHSVISGEVAIEMARGARSRTGADWAIAVTGVAGPDPQEGHAAGEVWLALAGRGQESDELIRVEQRRFGGDRAAIREATVREALTLLLGALTPV